METNDTIAAVATAPGGALAIIRLSGPSALPVAARVFRGSSPLDEAPPFTVHHGWIADPSGERLDEVLATVYRTPRSYTGQDMVEISCHGGALVVEGVLEAVLAAGARAAGPGEFTRRAFLNGRIDLSQAEAVADLIRSTSDRARRASLEQLRGRLGGQVRRIRSELIDCTSLLELEIDFAEEGIDLVSRDELAARLAAFQMELERARDSFAVGRMYREGVATAIVGPPNAGKSSVFNALLRSRRAIVTDIPGTTRDTLEEGILIDGVLFRLTDTAGMREGVDRAEIEGVLRSREAIAASDALLVVVDAPASESRWEEAAAIIPPGYAGVVTVLFNKSDLLSGVSPGVLETGPGGLSGIWISALTGEGMSSLRKRMAGAAVCAEPSGMFITSRRHRDAFERAARSTASAVSALRSGAGNEFAAFDLREAAIALGEITGQVTSEELLNHIFGQFCIGK